MARRLTVGEETEIVAFMRSNPHASERSVAKHFGRSRPTIGSLRSRYGLDYPQATDSSEESVATSATGGGLSEWLREEMAEVDRKTARWWASLNDEERAEIIAKGPEEEPADDEPGFLDRPLGGFEKP